MAINENQMMTIEEFMFPTQIYIPLRFKLCHSGFDNLINFMVTKILHLLTVRFMENMSCLAC